MGSTYPVCLAAADFSCIACTADAAGYSPLQRTVCGDAPAADLTPPAFQLLGGEEDFLFNDGRMGGLRIVLLTLSVVSDLTGRKGIRGIGLLPEGVANVPLVRPCQA